MYLNHRFVIDRSLFVGLCKKRERKPRANAKSGRVALVVNGFDKLSVWHARQKFRLILQIAISFDWCLHTFRVGRVESLEYFLNELLLVNEYTFILVNDHLDSKIEVKILACDFKMFFQSI